MIFSDKTAVDKALTAILIVSILVCALTVSYVIMFPKQGEKYTEFYILGTDGKADNYPLQFSEGAQKPVVVGVMNHEHRDVAYDLVVALEDGANITTLHSERIVLADNETRENTVNLTSDHAGTGMKADFLLYIDGNMTAPYRECYLWVNVTEKSKNAH